MVAVVAPERERKFVLIGTVGVGKTCLLVRYESGRYAEDVGPTIGVSFVRKRVRHGEGTVDIRLWDTTGAEAYRSLTRLYYRQAHCAIVVYDVTDSASFDAVDDWIADAREVEPKCVMALVGNKCDLAERRAITRETGEDKAREMGCAVFCETSAVTGEGVERLFSQCVAAVESEPADGSGRGASLVLEERRLRRPCC